MKTHSSTPQIHVVPSWQRKRHQASRYVIDLRQATVEADGSLQSKPESGKTLLKSNSESKRLRWHLPRLTFPVPAGWEDFSFAVVLTPLRFLLRSMDRLARRSHAFIPVIVGEISWRYQQWRNPIEFVDDEPEQPAAILQPFVPSIQKEITVFAVVTALLLIVVFSQESIRSVQAQRDEILRQGSVAIGEFLKTRTAITQGNWNTSLSSLTATTAAFEQLQRKFTAPDSVLLRVVGALPLTTRWHEGRALASVGTSLSSAGKELLEIVNDLHDQDASWTDRINTMPDHFQNATDALSRAQTAIGQLRHSPTIAGVSEELSRVLPTLDETVTLASQTTRKFARASGALKRAMGLNQLKRYLVVFENSDELRPAGGFMGSFALVDVVSGQVRNEEFPKGGSYDLQGSLGVRVEPPAPLAVFRPTWQFQDANWFVDWPTSARTIETFYEKSGGPTVDGVVAITSPILERLLGILGPLTVAGETLDASTVIERVQHKVEFEYDKKKNNPKEFIGELAIAVQQRLLHLTDEETLKLVDALDGALREKLILVYANDSSLERELVELGAAGEVREAEADYILIDNANIGGEKTDRVITSDVSVETVVNADRSLRNRVTIHRTHEGTPGTLFYGVKNVEYIRVYVPSGSHLVRASGFIEQPRPARNPGTVSREQFPVVQEYADRSQQHDSWQIVETQEYGKTVYGGWVALHAGASTTLELEYDLPMKFSDDRAHTLFIQKQPGVQSMRVGWRVLLPDGAETKAAEPADLVENSQSSTITFSQHSLTSDQLYGVIAHLSTQTVQIQ